MKPKLGFGGFPSVSPPSQLNDVFQLLPSFEQVPAFCQPDFHSSQLQESDQAAFAAAPTEKTREQTNMKSGPFFFPD